MATTVEGVKRIPALEAVRGAAALMVVAFHWWVFHETSGQAIEWADVAGYGWIGVQVFFPLSGLVLYLPYARGDRTLDLPSFAAARSLRILPAWWAAVIVGGAAIGTTWTWANVGELGFLQESWRPVDDPAPVGWTLVAEAGFYLVLPLLVWLGSRRTLQLPMVVLLILIGWTSINLASPLRQQLTPLAFVDQFAWGMLAAVVVARGVRVSWVAALGAAVLAVGCLLAAPRALESPYGFPYANGVAACVAVVLAWLASTRPRVPRPLVGLGTVSYGCISGTPRCSSCSSGTASPGSPTSPSSSSSWSVRSLSAVRRGPSSSGRLSACERHSRPG